MARIDGLNLSGASMNPAGAMGAAGAGSTADSQAALKARGKQDVVNLSNRGRIVAEASQAVRQSSDVTTSR